MNRASLLSVAALAAVLISSQTASAADDADPNFTGQLMVVGYNFCPRNWVEADGQTLSIPQNAPLFSLLGITYGGDGKTNFKLPDLRGRLPVGQGQGVDLPKVAQGEAFGAAVLSLTVDQLPPHRHDLQAADGDPNSGDPAGAVFATFRGGFLPYNNTLAPTKVMKANSIGLSGKGGGIDISSPAVGMRWCICLNGIFPSRP